MLKNTEYRMSFRGMSTLSFIVAILVLLWHLMPGGNLELHKLFIRVPIDRTVS